MGEHCRRMTYDRGPSAERRRVCTIFNVNTELQNALKGRSHGSRGRLSYPKELDMPRSHIRGSTVEYYWVPVK